MTEHRTIAVTGAAGFIGAAVARRYAAAGWTVRGLDLVDPAAADAPAEVHLLATEFAATGGVLRAGDVTDGRHVRDLVSGADVVVHTAALVAESGDWEEFDRVNAQAPRDVALAARDAGARQFVHLSSVMVHGFDFPEGCDEDGPLDPADNPYCATKIRSEALLAPLHDPGRFDVFIVRPGDVYGPGSVPWIVRPVRHLRERTFLYVDPGVSVINHLYVDNLVDAIEVLLATGTAAAGRPWIVTDGQRTLARDFFGRLAVAAGAGRQPALPGWLAEPLVGGAAAVLPERVRRRLDLDRQSIRYLRRRAAYSGDAIRALGWRPLVDLDEGMARTIDWLRAEGLVPDGG